MKIGVIVSSITLTFFIVGAVMLANLNTVNLLLNGSSSSTSPSSQFNVNGKEDEEPYNPTKVDEATGGNLNEMLQSGLSGGGASGNGLNLLWLLQNAKDPDVNSYAYQLLAAYSSLESGKYNNFKHHLSPSGMAGSHKNEASLASFAATSVKGYAESASGVLGKTINGKVITLENAVKADVAGQPYKEPVWKDANSDGCPDGPFQAIQCKPFNGKDEGSVVNKMRGGSAYDLYSFVDAMNVKDLKYNNIVDSFSGTGHTPSDAAVLMANALTHNRGTAGVGYLLFGMPYDYTRTFGKYLHNVTFDSFTPEQAKIATDFPEMLLKWFNKANLPLESVAGDNQKGQAVALLLGLSNGGFIDVELTHHSKQGINTLSDAVIGSIMPGQSRSSVISHINKTYVKKPWDVLGMSREKYDSIYGSKGYKDYPSAYTFSSPRNTFFYIDKNVKSDNYKAGENVVVRAIEGIAFGYMLDTGVYGEYTLLNIAINAGIKSLTDGTIVDPTNPQTVYKRIAPESSGEFNPASAASGNFGKFLDALGLSGKLSDTQQAQMKAMYEISGGYYSQTKRGKMSPTGEIYTDCSYYASYGLHLGRAVTKPYPVTDDIAKGIWLTNTNKTEEVNGQTYDAKVVQIAKDGSLLTGKTSMATGEYLKDKKWPDKLQTGDILTTIKRGHVMTYGGQNTTDKTMVLSPDISKVNANMSSIKAGEHFFMHSMGREGNTSKLMGLTPHISPYGGEKANHFAFRPVFNIR